MNTKYFTKEQLDKLKPLEKYLTSSFKYGYKRGTSTDENKLLIDVWFDFTSETLKNFSCGTCNLNNYKTVGKVYFESIEYYKNNETKSEEQCQEIPEATKGTYRKRKKQESL